jgi:hypothetical protein
MLNAGGAAPPMSDVANDAIGNLGREVDSGEHSATMFGTGSARVKEAAWERSRWSLPANWE